MAVQEVELDTHGVAMTTLHTALAEGRSLGHPLRSGGERGGEARAAAQAVGRVLHHPQR